MDIPKPKRFRLGRKHLPILALAAFVMVAAAAVWRLEPAAPEVDQAGLWRGSVVEGTMIRQVRGPGTLVPEQIRYISAQTSGRVERLLVEPGETVTPTTELLLLTNSEVLLEALEAQRQLAAAQANQANLHAMLENQRLNQEAAVASARSQAREAMRRIESNRELSAQGLLASNELKRSEDAAEELLIRLEVEEQRLEFLAESRRAQLQAQQAEIDRLHGLVALQEEYVASMRVTSGAHGVLRERALEQGQWVNPGDRLAVVVEPGRLKAELRIPETQARDVVVGQPASIDTRNGLIEGRVTRIDPAVVNGTVTVDVALIGELPRGARPDLSVDGVIEIERLDNVVYMERPAYGEADRSMGVFRIDEDGREAHRVDVQFGRSSVNSIEIRSGLQPGDVVILSDMSRWDGLDRIRLR